MIRLLLLYDTPGWACESECLALRQQLAVHAPGRFSVELSPVGVPKERLASFDVVSSTIYYHLAEASHPRSVSQISSYSYWIRKGWTAEQNQETHVAGWPHLRQWRFMVAKNKHIASLLTAEDHPRIRQLYHVFDSERWTPGSRPHNGFVIGYAGHRQALKGLTLISAAVETIPGARLAAPTWESGRLPHDAMPDFYRGLDVYVCMSKPGEDAGPRSPIEAALCGIPVVTTRGGQIGEMVEDAVTGLVVDRSIGSLREALLRLQTDPGLRARLSAAARETFLDKWVMLVGREWASYLQEIAET